MKIRSIVVQGIVVMLAVVVAAADARSEPSASNQRAEGVVDANGNLKVPSNYRTSYEFVGSWAIAAQQGEGSKDMHTVYASPGTIAAYRKDGHFPDGTVLVKEVFNAATHPMSTGTVSHEGDLKGWFVMVRDSKNSHPGNSLWGDGWGWSWFDAGNPSKTTSTNYKSECLGCHVPAQTTEWIYVEGYPPLAVH